MTPAEFYTKLLGICQIHGASMTSGYRTAKHNKDVGGSEWSQHRHGLAFDVVLDEDTERNRLLFKRDCWRFGLVVVDNYSKHIHVQAAPALDLSEG